MYLLLGVGFYIIYFPLNLPVTIVILELLSVNHLVNSSNDTVLSPSKSNYLNII